MNPYANPKDHIFKFYSDPAHGWLEMPSKLVKELNMGICQISEFSYYDKKTDFVYIEQDCDLLNVKREYEKKFKQKLLDPERVVHIDLEEDHFVMLYYVCDSDGDTIIYNEQIKSETYTLQRRVTPKQGRVVLFDGSYYHTAEQPLNNIRCVVNYNLR